MTARGRPAPVWIRFCTGCRCCMTTSKLVVMWVYGDVGLLHIRDVEVAVLHLTFGEGEIRTLIAREGRIVELGHLRCAQIVVGIRLKLVVLR